VLPCLVVSSATTGSTARERAVTLAVLVAIAVAHAPTLAFGFVSWDDPLYLTQNPLVLDPGAHSFLEHLFTPALGYPSPLTVLSYRIEHVIAGLDHPWVFHATNVLLHVLACFLAHRLARTVGLGASGAWLATLLFGLHPLTSEPVAWITGRKDLLAAVFALAALLRGVEVPFRWREPRTWLVVVYFACALAAKPVAAWVALALPLGRMILPPPGNAERPSWRAAALEALPLVALSLALFPLALAGHRAIGGHPEAMPDAGAYLHQLLYTLGFHIGLLCFAWAPSAKHLPTTTWPPSFDPAIDLAPVLFALVLLLAYRFLDAPRRPRARFALGLALLAYLPSSNFLPLTRAMADVYVYLPTLGVAMFLGLCLDRLEQRLEERGEGARARLLGPLLLPTVTLSLLLLLAPAEARWVDSASLWRQGYERYPHDFRLCRNYANGVFERDGPAAAFDVYTSCAERFGIAPFEKNIAIALVRLGRFEEARRHFEAVLRRDPDDQVAREYLAHLPPPL
jgi:tetratricopeptide (TPR) repeat protein